MLHTCVFVLPSGTYHDAGLPQAHAVLPSITMCLMHTTHTHTHIVANCFHQHHNHNHHNP
jgi:hypothetical protein